MWACASFRFLNVDLQIAHWFVTVIMRTYFLKPCAAYRCIFSDASVTKAQEQPSIQQENFLSAASASKTCSACCASPAPIGAIHFAQKADRNSSRSSNWNLSALSVKSASRLPSISSIKLCPPSICSTALISSANCFAHGFAFGCTPPSSVIVFSFSSGKCPSQAVSNW